VKIIHNATVITPRDGQVVSLAAHSLAFDAERIGALGPAEQFERQIEAGRFSEVIPGDRYVVTPGLVNTHHHLYQSLTRCLPQAQNQRLFDWLSTLYACWRGLDRAALGLAAQVSVAELLVHGCTTTSDHHYLFAPNMSYALEAVAEAAETLGIRLHLCRGAMTLGRARGGLPPDDCVEDDAAVLRDCQRAIEKYHDPSEYAMRRVDLAPCSPFNCTRELLRDVAELARTQPGVLLHTHLAETREEERFCQERYGRRPVALLAELGFLGPDVYLAHCVHVSDEEIALLATTRTAVSHNPSSNLRLGSGIAPLSRLLAAGVRVGLGVDGSSSNDGGNPLAEARQALLLARVRDALRPPAAAQPQARDGRGDDGLFPAAEAFRLATAGGAACLNRPVLGHLNPGAAADIAMFRRDDIALAGAVAHDPLAALVLCHAPRADRVYVAGREVVRDGRLTAVDEHKLAERMNRLVAERFGSPAAC